MSALEKKFQQEVIKRYQEAQEKCGYTPKRLLHTIEKFGAVKTIKEMIRKGQVSDGFDQFQKAGLMGLTIEATMITKEYGELFTDEEVNYCYELLCEYGYY